MANEDTNSKLMDEEGCKRRGQVFDYLVLLLENYWLYFDKRGNLNSDGRRLAAKAAREAARTGHTKLSKQILNILNNIYENHVDLLIRVLEEYGVRVNDTYPSVIYGPSIWRVRLKDK